MTARGIGALALLAAAAFGSCATSSIERADSPSEAVVRALLDAFNRHDIDAMSARVHDDVVWYSIAGDELGVDVRGVAALRDWLEGYFESLPDVRSRLLALGPGDAHVQTHECPTWTAKDGTRREQCAIGVYQIEAGRVRRVWYFPSEPPPGR